MEIKDKLLKEANRVKNNAYAIYSNYFVGAAIYSENKKIYSSDKKRLFYALLDSAYMIQLIQNYKF
jgi:hypothetical protein